MKKAEGSALLAVLIIIMGMSSVFIVMYYKHGLLIETVIEREKRLTWYYATQACMFYAIQIAKSNWHYLSERKDPTIYRDLTWYLSKEKSCKASVSFVFKQNRLEIVVTLYNNNNGVEQQLQATITSMRSDKSSKENEIVLIGDWKES